MIDPREINPSGVYSFSEAAKLIPSCRQGKRIHLATLYRWRQQGLIKAHQRGMGWFVFGSEILRLLHADEMPEFTGRSPAERRRDIDAAYQELKKLGV